MDNHYWMYRVSLEGLRMMDYCNEVVSLINYTLSKPRNISGGGIRCLYKRCKNKKISRSRCCYDTFLQKSSWRNIYVGLHTENHMFFTR
jgi:hypothetical protein